MVKWERMDKQVYWTQNTLENLKKKKIGACVFWAPVFFLSLLAGKFTTFEQMLLTEWIEKFFKKPFK